MSPTPRPSLAELAAGPIDDDDMRLMQQLAAHYDAIDPVPDGLVDRIQFGITLDALHAEIAELQRTSDLAGVRSDASTAQTITFTSPSLATMITVTAMSVERARIDGWAAPGASVSVELRTTEGVLTTVADADGRFVFEDVPRGLVHFVLRPPDRSAVVTPAIEI